VALFVLLGARVFAGPLPRAMAAKLTAGWLLATAAKLFVTAILIEPWPIPPFVLRYSIPPGEGLVVVFMEAIAALLFGAIVRFIRPAIPWKSVIALAEIWGAGRLAVWFMGYLSGQGFASVGVWCLYDALLGASLFWFVRKFTRGLARPAL
jgi:hypothetical protein